MEDRLTAEERAILLKLARQALEDVVDGKALMPLELDGFPPRLQELGAAFVTLTRMGQLRGCIGALEPTKPLAEDVREHAVAAGLQDYRFPPVQRSELADVNIEISRLTLPQNLEYESPDDLLASIRPGVDGVTLRDGFRRATFLPQVWHKIPDPATFLSHLCRKMGADPELWRHKKLKIQIYQVEEFRE
jgi:AmmeMemoRadiSam system protein A